MASVEKAYADALFSLLEDEKMDKSEFESVLNQLENVGIILAEVPDFVKLLGAPTVEDGQKLGLIEETFSGKVTGQVYNFLRLLTVNKRIGSFPRIYTAFRGLYNDRFNIAQITVTSSVPLTDSLRGKITAKMSQVIGKSVNLTEKIDKSIIGGIVVDYGNTRFDSSVKTRLNELKNSISEIIA
jgi:F-type H+-transporting ATPase subunit delta